MYAKRPARSRRPLAGAASVVTLSVLVAAVLTSAPPRTGADVGLAAAAVPAQTAAGATLRVGPGAQYTTIADAARAAKPGDTVVIAPGSYAGFQAPTSGTAAAPITFKADGGKVTLTSGGTGNGRLDLSGRSNLRFVGVGVSKSSRFGIYATNAQNITLQDCEVADSQDGGAVFVGGSNIRVIGCDVHGNNARGTSADMEGISLENIDGFEIAGNHVHDNGEEGIDAKYETRNGSIHGNRVENNRGPNIYVDSAHQIKVYDNISIGAKESSKAGIALAVENYSKTRKTYSVQIYNNVMIGNAGGGMSFWTEGSGSFTDIAVVNNTFVDNKKAGISIAGGQFAGTNILRNNLFSGNPTAVSGSASAFEADHNLFSGAGIGTDLVTGVVKFVNAAANDLRLAPGSAGIDAGSADAAPTTDLTGAPRPSGKGVDLGAYELQVSPPPAAPTTTVGIAPTTAVPVLPTTTVPTTTVPTTTVPVSRTTTTTVAAAPTTTRVVPAEAVTTTSQTPPRPTTPVVPPTVTPGTCMPLVVQAVAPGGARTMLFFPIGLMLVPGTVPFYLPCTLPTTV
ncbi:MAG: hypothetical protein EKK42_08450 [Pseudonocardiaceae bacterium]|nr:MAG: hypothetical protein EKK42_08450 [Pseudonocardiaceae bacterium]